MMRKIPTAFQRTYDAASKSRKSAILAFCGECMGYEINPADCTAPDCPLYHWRGWKRERPPSEAVKTAIAKARGAVKKPVARVQKRTNR